MRVLDDDRVHFFTMTHEITYIAHGNNTKYNRTPNATDFFHFDEDVEDTSHIPGSVD